MNEKAIEPFDPNKALESIKIRIRSEFASLIPEAQWNEMVKREVDAFFNDVWESDRCYSRRATRFGEVVQEELARWTREAVAKLMESPEWQAKWQSSGAPLASEKIEEMLVKHSPEVISLVLGRAFQEAFMQVRNNMGAGRMF